MKVGDIDVTLGVAPDRLADVLGVVERVELRPLVERTAMGRTNAVKVGGAEVRFASVEDLLVHKHVAGRPRDLEDVRGVLARQPGVDLAYVRRWLAEFDAALGLGAEAALDRLLRETE